HCDHGGAPACEGCFDGRRLIQAEYFLPFPSFAQSPICRPRSPHRGAAAVPAATTLAVNLESAVGDHDRVFELDESALGMLQRGLDRDHHSALERATGVVGIVWHRA